MKFLYLFYVSVYSFIGIAGVASSTWQMCKAKTKNAVAGWVTAWLFFAGLLAQFIAVGVQVIGG